MSEKPLGADTADKDKLPHAVDGWRREVISKPGAAICVERITPPRCVTEAISAALLRGKLGEAP